MSAYFEVPDAPWIRQAELYGPDAAEEIHYHCPCCGAEEPEDYYFDRNCEIVGCSECMKIGNAYAYEADKLEEERKCHE